MDAQIERGELKSFKLLHLSDLHFSEHADPFADATHSTEHIVDLRRALQQLAYNRVVVSGDLTDRGNPDAMLRVKDYLFRGYSIGGQQSAGLALDENIVRVIPGNHDAFDTSRNGDILTRWQRALKNYNDVFAKHKLDENGCAYEWLDCGTWGIYIAYADTCFLGDPDLEEILPTHTFADKIAKGKLARYQAKQLLDWYDLGREGKLPRQPGQDDSPIPADLYAKSFKILTMHHYVFEPPTAKSERLMQLCERNDVFRNIALSNFDVLLCGHKHVPHFGAHTYGFHLKRRGKCRYLLNYFRRTIGLYSRPMQDIDSSGKRWSRSFSIMMRVMLIRNRTDQSQGTVGNLRRVLREALDDPKKFRKQFKAWASDVWNSGAQFRIRNEEVEEVVDKVTKGFSAAERKKLSAIFKDSLKSIARGLRSRIFVQVMAGSATKKPSSKDKPRSFNLHTIEKIDEGYRFTSQRYSWCYDKNAFLSPSKTEAIVFPSALIGAVYG